MVREIVYRTHAALIFPCYALAPEKKLRFNCSSCNDALLSYQS
ncbi:hypothetical protein [Liquorilactobacillus vini]|nr:hypothetical protein [Liquorilactobacillus vini]